MTHQENLSPCGLCHEPMEFVYAVGWLDDEGTWHGKNTVCDRCAHVVTAHHSVEMGLEQLRLRCAMFGQRPLTGFNCPAARHQGEKNQSRPIVESWSDVRALALGVWLAAAIGMAVATILK